MAVVSALCPLSLQTIFDIDGLPVRPCRLFFFRAGTQTPLITYTDALLSIPHPQPVESTGSGRVPPIFVGTDAYRVRIFDSFAQLIEDIDGISGAVAPSDGGGGGGTVDPRQLITTGDYIASFSNALRDGFVRANGNTLGSATSGASERANADCQALFKFLWGQDSAHLLPILGGRGASADGDWSANKQITLPDLKGRALMGVDGMGGVASGRLTGAVLDVGTPAQLGGAGGRATHVLTLAQSAAHGHGASGFSDAIGSHVHTGGTDVQGTHGHTVPGGAGGNPVNGGVAFQAAGTGAQTTDQQGAHNHNLIISAAGTHQHVLTVNIAGAGGDQAHPQVPPFQTSTIYIKL